MVLLQSRLVQTVLTRFMGRLSRSTNAFVKTCFIQIYLRLYQVDLTDAIRKLPSEYRNFEDFFTRELAQSARPICADPNALVSPVDGVVAEQGLVAEGVLIQAKGISYQLNDLLGGSVTLAAGTEFATLYLAPKDYHRIHAPMDLTLEDTVEIAGTRYPVNTKAVQSVPDLFTQNVRLVCRFSSNGKTLYAVFVGALIVAGIRTTFDGGNTPYAANAQLRRLHSLHYSKGEELARFVLGSTVILIVPPELGSLDHIRKGDTIRMGQRIGSLASVQE